MQMMRLSVIDCGGRGGNIYINNHAAMNLLPRGCMRAYVDVSLHSFAELRGNIAIQNIHFLQKTKFGFGVFEAGLWWATGLRVRGDMRIQE